MRESVHSANSLRYDFAWSKPERVLRSKPSVARSFGGAVRTPAMATDLVSTPEPAKNSTNMPGGSPEGGGKGGGVIGDVLAFCSGAARFRVGPSGTDPSGIEARTGVCTGVALRSSLCPPTGLARAPPQYLDDLTLLPLEPLLLPFLRCPLPPLPLPLPPLLPLSLKQSVRR